MIFRRLIQRISRQPDLLPPDPEITGSKKTQAIGRWGEDWAIWKYRQSESCVLLDRNFLTRDGELDLVLRTGDQIIFSEVKTRIVSAQEPDLKAIIKKQREHFQRAAREYYEKLPALRPFPRFDVVLIQYDPAKNTIPDIKVLRNTIEPVNLR